MILGNFHDVILVLQVLVELKERGRFEIMLRVENCDAAAQADDRRRPAPARMPDGSVGAAEAEGIVPRQRALLNEKLAHGHHFPLDLLALSAKVINTLAGSGMILEMLRTPPFCQARDSSCEFGFQSNFSAALTCDVVRSKQTAMSFWPSVTK